MEPLDKASVRIAGLTTAVFEFDGQSALS
jgi:hypothetical protein